jgi:hypothetical protein
MKHREGRLKHLHTRRSTHSLRSHGRLDERPWQKEAHRDVLIERTARVDNLEVGEAQCRQVLHRAALARDCQCHDSTPEG